MLKRYFITKNGTFLKCCWSDRTKQQMEKIVADMQREDTDSEYKLYEWDGELIYSLLETMRDKKVFQEINWNWDKKYSPVYEARDEDWDIT